MGGTYDNPVTIKSMKINGEEVDLIIEGLPTKAGSHESGNFKLAGHDVEFHRATNYQPLRIKSTNKETGFMILDLTNITSLEIELVFTTAAVTYFTSVNLDLSK